MKHRNWQQSWIFAMIAITGFASAASVLGDKLFWHHAKRSNACYVRDYEYDFFAGAVTTRAIAIAPVDQPQRIATGAAPDPLGVPGEKLRKAFFVDRTSFEADHVTLSRVSLAIYNDGRYAGTGILSFDGGPDGAFHGANVLIRVRAYAGSPQAPGGLDHMRLLWHTRQLVWIGRQQTKAISLFPEPPRAHPIQLEQATPTVLDSLSQAPSFQIREHFHELTHFEIIVERQQDR
jgi:hypothetical protein